jgi:hypothetical protein
MTKQTGPDDSAKGWRRIRIDPLSLRARIVLALSLTVLAIVLVIVLACGGDDSEDVVSGDTPGSATPTATASAGATPTPTHTPVSAGPRSTVSDISYGTDGGQLGEAHLLVAVTVSDGGEQPVRGASVSARLSLNGGSYATKRGITGSDGSVELKFTNAPSGCYDTVITDVTAGLTLSWDGSYPDNGFAKGGAVC